MKDKNKTLIAIIAVLLIIAIVGGSTFAYWQWSTNTNQRTNVVITVSGGAMTIDGGGNITTATLAPAACTNTTYAIQRKVTVGLENDTNTAMTATLKLNVTALTPVSGRTLADTQKQYLKWALVPVESAAASWAGCTATGAVSGTFSGVTTGNAITLTTIAVPASTDTTKYYQLYLWIDSSYTYTNQGSSNTDPLQGVTLNLAWAGTLVQDH